jgi:hypothetical protein
MDKPENEFFSVPGIGDTTISGMKGSDLHAHETPFGCGSIADQTVENGQGRHLATYNRFNDEVDTLLKDFPALQQ